MINIKLGVIPTRRDIFSKEEALKRIDFTKISNNEYYFC